MHLVKHPKCALKSLLYCFSAFQHINRSGVKEGGGRVLKHSSTKPSSWHSVQRSMSFSRLPETVKFV